ncbi:ankyrin repeat-containing domain protein [Cladorrhinum sp. PSN332]|nr:ankyrin repeat-containing domain protein [Cladorrhinum sp. PSN332]
MAERLDDAYDRDMKRAKEAIERGARRKEALNILSWTFYARRPLSVGELLETFRVQPLHLEPKPGDAGKIKLSKAHVYTEIDDLFSLCASLLTRGSDDKVRSIHFTTRQYFLKHEAKWVGFAEAKITKVLVGYMSLVTEDAGPLPTYQELKQQHPLCAYATLNWGHHAREGLRESDQVVEDAQEAVCNFLRLTRAVMVAIQGLHHQIRWAHRYGVGQDMNRLHLVAYFGVSTVLKPPLLLLLLCATPPRVPDQKDCLGRTPLSYAAQNVHSETVRALLEFEAAGAVDVNSTSPGIPAPLFLDAEDGHFETVDILLGSPLIEVDMVEDRWAGNGSTLTTLLHVISSAPANCKNIVESLFIRGKARTDILNNEGRIPLFKAVERRSDDCAKLLLDHRAANKVDPNAVVDCAAETRAHTALLLATKSEYWDVSYWLLEAGADPNLETRYGDRTLSPLYWAAAWPEPSREAVKFLLHHGAKPDMEFRSGYTVLGQLVKEGEAEEAEIFLTGCEGKIDPNSPDSSGRRPLDVAAESGKLEMASLLVRFGAKLEDARSRTQQVLLNMAARKGDLGMVRGLLGLEGIVSLDDVCPEGARQDLFAWAAEGGEMGLVKSLFHPGTSPNASQHPEHGATPLACAALSGHTEVVRYLIEVGADKNDHSFSDHRSLLSAAVTSGNLEIVTLLIDAGSNVDVADDYGATALHRAAREGRLDILQELLRGAATPDVPDTYLGQTPLYFAAREGQTSAVHILLKEGADARIHCDMQSRTPLQASAVGGHLSTVSLLLPLSDLEATDSMDRAVLLLATMERQPEVVELLLNGGQAEEGPGGLNPPNINATDNRGRTALFLAAEECCAELFEALLKRGARTDIPDEIGLTVEAWLRLNEGRRPPYLYGDEDEHAQEDEFNQWYPIQTMISMDNQVVFIRLYFEPVRY